MFGDGGAFPKGVKVRGVERFGRLRFFCADAYPCYSCYSCYSFGAGRVLRV